MLLPGSANPQPSHNPSPLRRVTSIVASILHYPPPSHSSTCLERNPAACSGWTVSLLHAECSEDDGRAWVCLQEEKVVADRRRYLSKPDISSGTYAEVYGYSL